MSTITPYDPSIMLHPNAKNLKALITIEGNIGAGKSTVLRVLEEQYPYHNNIPIIYVPEPDFTTPISIPPEYDNLVHSQLENKSLLQYFYTDLKGYAFQFQVMAYCKRCNDIYAKIAHVIQSEQEYIIVTERSVISDKEIFTKTLIETNLFPIELIETYDMFWQQLAGKIAALIKGMIILTADTTTLQRRIAQRGRLAESGVTTAYLEQLAHRHDLMADKYKDTIAVAHIDWHLDIPTDAILSHILPTLQSIIDTACNK